MASNNSTQHLTLTGSAQQLANAPVFNGVTITAKSTNTGDVGVGFTSGVTATNAYVLEKGQSIKLQVPNTNAIFVNGTASDIVSTIGS